MVLLRARRAFNRFFMKTPLYKLVICTGVGACVVQTFGYLVRNQHADKITYTDYYREALALTKEHPGSEYLFGAPINFKGLDAANKNGNIHKHIPLAS